MGKLSAKQKDHLYYGASALGSVGAGVGAMFAASTIIPTIGSGALFVDLVVMVTTFVGAGLFRPRSDAEIKMLLGKSDLIDEIKEVEAAPAKPAIAAAKNRKEAEKKLVTVMDKILRVKTALGDDVVAATVRIFENLSVITKKWDTLEGYAEVRYTVETMMDDYLPTSIYSYLAIPTKDDAKLAAKLKSDLLDQLNILESETAKIRKNLLADDIQDFNVQGNFLKSRFQQSDTTHMLTVPSSSSPMTIRVPASAQMTDTNLTARISIGGPRSKDLSDIPLPPSFN